MKKLSSKKNRFTPLNPLLNCLRQDLTGVRGNLTGFTIIEVMAAVFVILIGLIGAMAAISRTIIFTSISASQLQAAYLSQEGIEIVRNIRDGNWLTGRSWDDGLTEGDREADYSDTFLTPWIGGGRFLNIDSSGFYSYDVFDNPTKFKRKITITIPATLECPAGDCLLVKVEVFWQERGQSYSFSAQENLYNWR